MYERALSPIEICGVEVKNRVARAAHATMMSRAGKITDELIAYHAPPAPAVAWALSILEAAGVHPSSVLSLANLDDLDHRRIPGAGRGDRAHRHETVPAAVAWRPYLSRPRRVAALG